MKFIDWVAAYYLENPGQVLRMCLQRARSAGR
jgi:primosomal protein N'